MFLFLSVLQQVTDNCPTCLVDDHIPHIISKPHLRNKSLESSTTFFPPSRNPGKYECDTCTHSEHITIMTLNRLFSDDMVSCQWHCILRFPALNAEAYFQQTSIYWAEKLLFLSEQRDNLHTQKLLSCHLP